MLPGKPGRPCREQDQLIQAVADKHHFRGQAIMGGQGLP